MKENCKTQEEQNIFNTHQYQEEGGQQAKQFPTGKQGLARQDNNK